MSPRRPNRLAGEQSPYLLQHAHNPVDWFPWGEAAFNAARERDKPVFLSIGYATCHWCHVMERESFEDEEVAALLNEAFVCVKVDREERPDVDSIYMTVCQLLTGSGGWPLTIVMTPDQEPFFAATYIPKRGRFGRTGLVELIPRLQEVWADRRDEAQATAAQVVETLRLLADGQSQGEEAGAVTWDKALLHRAFRALASRHDHAHGGFGAAPKFPQAHYLGFLLRHWRRSGDERVLEMVRRTLTAMRRGGLFDQVGFGFHRYATDKAWLLPHFEKMLYDQATLALAYAEAYQATGDESLGRIVREILTYVLRDLADPGGGFHSAEDADSEGEEGKFYLWTLDEVRELLGPEQAYLAERVWGLTTEGNFAEEASGRSTGRNILHLPRPLAEAAAELGLAEVDLAERLEAARRRLFEARAKRVRPLKDDKVLTDWNGLIIAALAFSGRALAEPEYVRAAVRAAEFILATLRRPDGRLLHRYRAGVAGLEPLADDYAHLIWGLIELHQATQEPRWLGEALALTDRLIADFWDEAGGGFFQTGRAAAELPARLKESQDAAQPSANSVALLCLLRLARLTGRVDLEERAAALMNGLGRGVVKALLGHAFFLAGVDFALGPSYEAAVVGDPASPQTQAFLAALARTYLPHVVLLLAPEGPAGQAVRDLAPFTAALTAGPDGAQAYVCRAGACLKPVSRPEELLELVTSQR